MEGDSRRGPTGPPGPARTEPIHPLRWRLLAAWIIVFTGLMFWAVYQNRTAIQDLKVTKANLHALERTNCALRSFLYTAYQARTKAATDDRDPAVRAADRAAAQGYLKLYKLFPQDHCPQGVLPSG